MHLTKNSDLPHHITTNFTRNTKFQGYQALKTTETTVPLFKEGHIYRETNTLGCLGCPGAGVDWIPQCLILSPFTNINFNDKFAL